ncbi:MAG: HAMP domain-containing histidine kinase [Bacteroidia bacterium]|nr:HAMP domain-containing histidine kinase [Bacteroidia bacterium]NNF31891.1 HAMP domain-containing histidine kinase [Flavobacteriaceae bacterium]MBT8277006.1 HAMP domain-containing histidine kinase [Bacteroidia bacterium]NNJ82208.1 HAMP domain-containing histidine kinase [Flavobacteriaceae bacterium]NNK53579.1 HAMP domain-containing histidine kinase [Flavobacteriaceae bacterium]
MSFLKQNVWTLVIFIIGIIAIFLIDRNQIDNDLQKNKLKIEQVHQRSVSQFTTAINEFAAMISGMKVFMNESEELPSAEILQHFVQKQLEALQSTDSIAVSFIDSTHTFIYSFTRHELDPNDLAGVNVSSLRSEEKIAELNDLMKTDSLLLFAPLNLVEGWVGVPLNFRVHREGKTLGYLAPILKFKTLMRGMYSQEISKDFVFRFRWEDEFEFDREQVYNNTKVYNKKKDPEYYGNFNVDDSDFITSDVKMYGRTISISTAYKNGGVQRNPMIYLLLLGHLVLTGLFYVLNKLRLRSKELNRELETANQLLGRRGNLLLEQNKELVSVNKTKDKLFSIIGHDLKQPLHSISGLLHLLENENIEDSTLQNLVIQLKRTTNTTTELLSNLLRWAASQTGDLKYQPGWYNLNFILETVIGAIKPAADLKSITIKYSKGENVQVYADLNMLSTVFRNLLSNALKYTSSEGTIHLSLELNANYAIVHIQDNGVGMKPEEVARFYDLESQISKLGTSGEVGTGIGLLLCQQFMEINQGKIEVTSKENEGTRFSVYVPLKGVK